MVKSAVVRRAERVVAATQKAATAARKAAQAWLAALPAPLVFCRGATGECGETCLHQSSNRIFWTKRGVGIFLIQCKG